MCPENGLHEPVCDMQFLWRTEALYRGLKPLAFYAVGLIAKLYLLRVEVAFYLCIFACQRAAIRVWGFIRHKLPKVRFA